MIFLPILFNRIKYVNNKENNKETNNPINGNE